jgi:hypothetical protein
MEKSTLVKVALGFVAVAILFMGWRYVSGPKQPTRITQQTATPVSAPPVNVSADCPGVLSALVTLTTEENTFNPKGCYEYHTGKGTVIFKGMGDLQSQPIDLAVTTPVAPWTFRSVRAVSGTATFSFILCSAPKQHMERLDCS